MAKKLRKSNKCLNCGARINNSNYCPQCGQLNTNKQVSLKQFMQDFLGDYFTFDSKLFRSFLPLVSKPGYLTKEYVGGKHARYILPLRLYIFTTFFFFLIIALNNKIEDLSENQLNKIETVADEDSLYQFLSDYHPNILPAERMEMVSNLHSHFEITYLDNGNNKSVLDTLKQTIQEHTVLLPDNVSRKLSREIFIQFKIRGKDKQNIETDLGNLDEIISQYSELINEKSRGMIVSAVDSAYRIKTILRKSDLNKVKIFNQDADSENSRLGNFIEAKIKKIASRGDEGGLQFLSEMVDQIPKVLFLLLPIFALLMKLFYIRHNIFYINHLIFALHLHTIFFIYLLIPLLFNNSYVVLVTLVALWIHVYMAFHNVYEQRLFKTFVKMNSVMFIYTFVLFAGIILILFLAILST